MTPASGADPGDVLARLRERYGPLEAPRVWDPLDELILTILSQNTSDANSGRAFAALREAFQGGWDEVVDASVEEVADAIRSGGLANTKAPRIQAVLREIAGRQGGFDLSWMRDAGEDEVADFLASLPGVGPKTVACVLAFSLGRDVCPVDTHVHRAALRLGLIPPKTGADAAHRLLAEVLPVGTRVEMHVGMIALGRDACRAQKPKCRECALVDVCPSAESS